MPHALITGASQGFGRALLAELVRRSWTCTVDARDASALHAATAGPARCARRARRRRRPGAPRRLGERSAGPARSARAQRECARAVSAAGARPLPARRAASRLRDRRDRAAGAHPARAAGAPPGRPRPSSCSAPTPPSRPYPGWGGYGSAKAALDQLAAVLGVGAPRSARVRVRPRRHAHRDAPGGLPRRGHLRPPRAGHRRPRPAAAARRPPTSGRYRAADLLTATR